MPKKLFDPGSSSRYLPFTSCSSPLVAPQSTCQFLKHTHQFLLQKNINWSYFKNCAINYKVQVERFIAQIINEIYAKIEDSAFGDSRLVPAIDSFWRLDPTTGLLHHLRHLQFARTPHCLFLCWNILRNDPRILADAPGHFHFWSCKHCSYEFGNATRHI